MKYTVDATIGYDEGGSAEFYDISQNPALGFKQFHSEKTAKDAFVKQKILSRYDLAPRIIGKICKLPIFINGIVIKEKTNWGFITEKARLVDEKIMRKRLPQIQKLVDSIHTKTGLKFWDCHYYNIGYIKRHNKPKLVCIDTGNESFNIDCNAWGFSFPGPKCNYCNKYQCVCADY